MIVRSSSPSTIDISKGSSFAGKSPYLGVPPLMIGCVMMVAGMIDDLILIPMGLALAAAGLVIFMKIKGVTIDPQEGRLRIYENYLLFRLGRWMDLSTYDRIVVKRYRERVSHRVGGMFLGSNANINCFQVTLAGGPQDVELKEFLRKKDALELARKVSISLGLPVIDQAIPRQRVSERRR